MDKAVLLAVGGIAGYTFSLYTDSSSQNKNTQEKEEKKKKKQEEKKIRLLHEQEINERMINAEPEEFYDMVFYIGSPTSIVQGWPLKTNKESRFDEFSGSMNGVVVAIIGGFDKGKSMLFNKLVGTPLPSGARVHTRGLSFRALEYKGKHLVLIDSAGLNSPIKINPSTNSVQEKEAEEMFMQDIIFEIADLFIYVVNEITWREQIQLHHFTQRLKESNKSFKQVFVVHNFKNSNDNGELWKLWKEQVLHNYQTSNVTEQHLNTTAENPTTSQIEERPVPFLAAESMSQRHFFIGNENSDSANLFNPWSYALIRSSLCLVVAENWRFDLVERLRIACVKYLPAYVEPKELDVVVERDEASSHLVMRPRKPISIKTSSTSRLTPYWNVNPDDSDRKGLDEHQTVYDVYRFSDYYQVTIEAAGVQDENLKIKGTISSNILEVNFTIPEPNQDKVIDKVQSRRKFGPQQVHIQIPNEFDITQKVRKVTINNGLIEIVLPRI
eukprot:TRINITY_DN15371_c0_g1_i1.p1 TRINITY_DN15371_c0_g1~~TRINITY_DN15371_c0_g1_i1.p1  ORF type:complete len:511 (+),score=92.78 TRINITY_DN15371_c0_g1_i1:40-1533(+)